ncbi:MAG: hypothetical protein ACD_50C00313G0001 [uncultured bacterium]|nr:MAG: hypothetical protein ACD_50C00313G0001 [uncultured bacterium]
MGMVLYNSTKEEKMRIILVIFIAIVAVGCGKISDNKGGWVVVQSPLSGACYEAYDAGFERSRVFSLGKEVKCPPRDQLK